MQYPTSAARVDDNVKTWVGGRWVKKDIRRPQSQ